MNPGEHAQHLIDQSKLNPEPPMPMLPESNFEELKQTLEQIRSIASNIQTGYEEELEQYRKALDMIGKFIRFLSEEQPESDDKFNAKTRSYYTDHGIASELFQQAIPSSTDIAKLVRGGWRALRDKPQPAITPTFPSA